ncbi:MAG: hypothetical protein PHS74_00100 [Lachnospiraceae bacterium]|nr:hypothetical protein [Lachnospiraceae bacterium]
MEQEEIQLYYDIANHATNGIYVIDRDNHNILFLNQKMKKLLQEHGIVMTDGKKCYEALMGYSLPCKNCAAKIHACDGKASEMYSEVLVKFHSISSHEIVWKGRPAAVVYLRDTTDTHSARNNLAIAMEHAKMLYWEYDMAHATASANAAVREWFGMPEKISDYPESYLKKAL